MRVINLVFCLLLTAVPVLVQAQDRVIVVRPGEDDRATRRAAERAVRIFNYSNTTRIFGRHTIRSNDIHGGDVAVLNGPIVVGGVIEGDLIAINADVELTSRAEVSGDVLVLGGTIDRSARARVGGVTRRYSGRVRVRRDGERLELLSWEEDRRERRPDDWRRRSYSEANASIVLSTGWMYNRVEGLPIHIGPRLTWSNSWYTRLRLEALGIFRTAGDLADALDNDLQREDVGYAVRGEIQLGRSGEITVGGTAYDVVSPMSDWQLHDHEIGAASFFLHHDYRDYYLDRGFTGYVTVAPTDELSLFGEVKRSEQTSVAARDPWTLFSRDEEWRENPFIDEGRFLIFTAEAEFDSRRSHRFNGSGWFLRATWERGKSDNVVEQILPLSVRPALPTVGSYVYDRMFLDLRRYERVGWGGQLSLRGLLAGDIGENDPLPVQRRLSIGHSMPGYGFRSFACNENLPGDPSMPAMCDYILLVQAEYRGNLSFGWRSGRDSRPGGRDRRDRRHWGDDRWWDWDDWADWFWFDGPTLVVFSDAGTGWLSGEDIRDVEFDIGAGLEFGSLGVYAAKALTSEGPVRVTVRLQRRF